MKKTNVINSRRGFLEAVGVSIEEVKSLKLKELWTLVYSFCSLNNTILIFGTNGKYVLSTFNCLTDHEKEDVVKDYCATLNRIKKELRHETI